MMREPIRPQQPLTIKLTEFSLIYSFLLDQLVRVQSFFEFGQIAVA